MLKKIIISLQTIDQFCNKDFKENFIKLLSTASNVTPISGKSLEVKASSLFPITQIIPNSASTYINFEDDSGIQMKFIARGLTFGVNIDSAEFKQGINKSFQIFKDEIGEYCQVDCEEEPKYQLTMQQLYDRFAGKIKEVNHTGINFSPDSIPDLDYQQLKSHIARNSFLVNYPTGDEWPFIIPCTKQELGTTIQDQTLVRHPLFEFVYSKYNSIPVIQFDIRPDLSKEEVMSLLPEPYGISFEGLENSIRTVFVLTDMPGLLIRFDIGLRSVSTNSFYPWMIKEGGRVK